MSIFSSFWGTEARELHSDPEQLKRQKSAKRIQLDPTRLDPETATCAIKDYVVNLAACTCRDAAIRRMPCKHMYRLAHELGVFDLGGLEAEPEPPPGGIQQSIAALSLAAGAELRDFLYLSIYHGNKPENRIYLSTDTSMAEVINVGFLCATANSSEVKGLLKKRWGPLIDMLDEQGVSYERMASKNRRVDLKIVNPTHPRFILIEPSPFTSEHMHRIYRAVLKQFPRDEEEEMLWWERVWAEGGDGIKAEMKVDTTTNDDKTIDVSGSFDVYGTRNKITL